MDDTNTGDTPRPDSAVPDSAVPNVAEWLGTLGLEQYITVFVENDVDYTVLPELDHELLKEMGISSIGHRLKILKAAKATAETAPSTAPDNDSDNDNDTHNGGQLAAQAHPTETEAPSTPVVDSGERKQLTVMFCDMVGSTRLSTLYDPEDYTSIIRSYHATCTSVINRYEGYVARYMGDGVLAYFGYPQSYENNAERAIRAALEAVNAVLALEPFPGLHLQCRIGIATGLVVVGEKQLDAGVESVASGDTPNLAARLQSLAEPDQVVVAGSTRKLCGDLFEWTALGEHTLKGFATPIPAYAVAQGSAVESRFTATRHTNTTGMVGRDPEIALLHDRWQSTTGGDGQMVLVTGEAGLGKSRLVHEATSRLQSTSFVKANLQCSPYHTESALYPLVDYFSRLAGLLPRDSESVRRDKLLSTFAGDSGLSTADQTLLLQLNGIQSTADHTDDQDKQIPSTAEQRRQRTLDLLIRWFTELSQSQPLLMVVEDVHWMDPTTHAFLLQLLDALPGLPILVIATARPSLTYDFGGHTTVTQMALNRLARGQMSEIISLVTRGKSLPDDVTRDLIAKADGIPLYVEELTRYVLESGRLIENDKGYELTGPMQQITIPSTLYDSLSARLDRLGDAKEIAQVGAVIGREFNLGLLQAVLGMPEENLLGSLMILMNIGLLSRKTGDNGTSFLFKHALMRDAAYQGLLYSHRRHWHQQIANTINELFPSIAETQPEVLAQHYSDAGMLSDALKQWHLCAARNLKEFNNIEAAEQAGHGLALLNGRTDREDHVKGEITLHLDIAYALRASEGYSASGSESAFMRAYELASTHRDEEAMSASATGLCSAYHVGGQMRKAHDIAVRLGKDTDSEELIADSRFLQGQTLYSLGQQHQALEHYEQTIASIENYTALSASAKLRHKLFDRYCASWQYMQRCKLLLGYPDQADVLCEKAVKRAFDKNQPIAKCATLIGHCLHLQHTSRDPSRQAGLLDAITDQHRAQYWSAWSSYCNGVAAMFQGSPIEAERLLGSAIEAHRAMNSSMGMPTMLGALATVQMQQQLHEKALDTFDQAIEVARSTEEHCDEPELHRLRGECILAKEPVTGADRAAQSFDIALKLAKKQDTRWWQLRAATSAAQLWFSQDMAEQSVQVLRPVFDSMTEGATLKPYIRAKAILDRCESAIA